MFPIDSAALDWAALAIAAAVVEILVPHFGVIFVAMGAAIAGVVALFVGSVPVQIFVFFVSTAVAVTLLRQRFVKWAAGSHYRMRSRSEALVGHDGVVTLDIEPLVGSGRVTVGGEDWAARAATPLAAGTRVRVVSADGIVLEVTPV